MKVSWKKSPKEIQEKSGEISREVPQEICERIVEETLAKFREESFRKKLLKKTRENQ